MAQFLGYSSVSAFYACLSLTNITIPNSVTTIGDSSFRGCSSLKVFSIPNSVTSIGVSAFSYCTSLLNISIPNSVTSLGFYAFDYCTEMTNITIGTGITNLESQPFHWCTGLKSFTVDALNPAFCSIDGVLFDKTKSTLIQCPSRLSCPGGLYVIPSGVTNIKNNAFVACIGLTSIMFPKSVTVLGQTLFGGCTVENVFFEGNVPPTNIGAFWGANPVTFYYCAGTTGWDSAFTGAKKALWFEQSPTNGFIYDITNSSITITGYLGFGGKVTMPDVIDGKPVTGIGTFAFGNLTNLTGVSIPNSVTTIGDQAFYSCTALTEIMIPNSVTYIGWYAFDTCTGLTNISIGTGLTSLGVSPFHRCNNLQYFTVDALNPAFCSIDGVLFDKNQTLLIKCPARKSGAYEIPGGVTKTSDWAFFNCINLTNIKVPKSFTTFGISTFLGCSSLMKVYFEGNAPGGAYYSQFDQTSPATIYYRAGATGWSNTYAGQPTSLWNPQALTSDAAFGVQTNQYGFNISGAAGITVVVEACTNLANPTWLPVATNTFTSASSYFSDPQWTNYPSRFYRFSMP